MELVGYVGENLSSITSLVSPKNIFIIVSGGCSNNEKLKSKNVILADSWSCWGRLYFDFFQESTVHTCGII